MVVEPRFVGRAHVREHVARRLVRGEGGTVLIRGVSGVGKTALLRVLAAAARQRLVPVIDLLDTDGSVLPVTDLRRAIAGWVELDGDLDPPGSATVSASAGVDVVGAMSDPRRELFGAVRRLRSDDAVLCVIDDLQDADPDVATLLGELLVAARHLPVVIAAATRTDVGVPAAHVAHVLGLLDDGPSHTTFDLDVLARDEVRELAADRLGPATTTATVDRVVEWTGGLPVLVRHALDELADPRSSPVGTDGTASIRSDFVPTLSYPPALVARLRRLAPGADQCAVLISAVGEVAVADLPVLADVLAQPARDVGRAVDALVAAGVLVLRSQGREEVLGFRHPMVAASVEEVAGAAERSILRRELVGRLVAAHRGASGERLLRGARLVAEHHDVVGVDDEVTELLIRAAEHATFRSPRLALSWLDLLPAVPGSPDVRVARLRLEALTLTGRLDEAIELGLETVRGLDDDAAIDEIGGRLLLALIVAGRAGEGAPIADRLVRLTEDRGATATFIWSHAAALFAANSELDRAERLAMRVLGLGELDPWHRVTSAQAIVETAIFRGRVDVAGSLLDAASGDLATGTAFAAAARKVYFLLWIGRITEGMDLLGRLEEDARVQTVMLLRDAVCSARLLARMLTCRWPHAAPADVEAELAVVTPFFRDFVAISHAFVTARRGRHDQARAWLAHVHPRTGSVPEHRAWIEAFLAQREGDHDRAVRIVGTALDRFVPLGRIGGTHLLVATGVASLVAAGRRDAARELLDATPVAPCPWADLVGRRSAALIEDDAAAVAATIELAAASGNRTEWFESRVTAAELGGASDAELGALYRELKDLGDGWMLGRVRDVLVRQGLPLPRRRPGRPELSEQDERISALVADGLTNREIAERLHLSHHTVGNYLRRIYRAHGVANRAELAAVRRRRGDDDVVEVGTRTNRAGT